MGAWGSGPFEDDDGSDRLHVLEGDPGTLRAILRAFPATEEPDATATSMAVAAAALVGAVTSGIAVGDPVADEWLAENQLDLPDGAVQLARAAVTAARDQPNELAELWSGADALDQWHDSLTTTATSLDRAGMR